MSYQTRDDIPPSYADAIRPIPKFTAKIKEHDNSFGFGVRSLAPPSISRHFIHYIHPAGPAEGKLQHDDEVIKVNGVVVDGLNHTQLITRILQTQGSELCLEVARTPKSGDFAGAVPTCTPSTHTVTDNIHQEIDIVSPTSGEFGFAIAVGTVIQSNHADICPPPPHWVSNVIEGSPADDGNLKIGDAITKVNGTDVTTGNQQYLISQIRRSQAKGTNLRLSVVRYTKPPWSPCANILVTFARRKVTESFGLQLIVCPPHRHLIVSGVIKKGNADGKLRMGDRILKINGVDVGGMVMREVIEMIKGLSVLRVEVERWITPQERFTGMLHTYQPLRLPPIYESEEADTGR